MADELGTEDYAMLHQMLVSDDKAQRTQGMSLAMKLTGPEAAQFFDYQKTANAGKGEMGRADATLAGMPVELALAGGSTVGKLASALSGVARVLPQKAVNGVAAAGDVVSPDVIGMVSPRAGRAVELAQRIRKAQAAPVPASAPASPPPAPEPVSVPPTTPPSPVETAPPFNAPRLVVSPQKLANDLGIAAKRAGVTVTAADDVAVIQAVRGGADPAAAIADVVAAKAPTDPAAELARRFGLPSDAERTFPPNKSGLPTKPTKADAKANINAARARTAP